MNAKHKRRKQANRARAMTRLLAAKMSGKITAEQFKTKYARLTKAAG